MQFRDINELKQFIIWSREQGITRFKLGDLVFSASPLSQKDASTEESEPLKEMQANSKAWIDTAEDDSDEDLYT